MELKPGYKMTEVGVIPEDWEVKKLGECAKFRTGPFGSSLHKSDYVNDGIPVINPMHIIAGKIEPTSTMTVKEQTAERLNDFRLKENDIVIGRRGDMGRCAVVKSGQSGWLCGTGSMIVQAKYLDVCFLQRVLSSPFVITAIEDTSVGTTMINLNQRTLSELKIQFPPLPEQRAIAEALGDVDALLDGLDRLIEKKRAIKQGAMQELLTGKVRLPGFEGAWEVRGLGEVCRITTGKKDVNEGSINGQYPFFTCSRTHIYSDSYSFDTEAILVAGNGDVGNLHFYKGKFEAYQRTYVLSDFTMNVGYLWQQLSAYLAESLGLGKIGSSIPYIKKSNLIDFSFKIPSSPAEQEAVAKVLSDMDAEIAALEARRAKTRDLKQGMMQELLTGKTRLVSRERVVDREVEVVG